MKAIVEWFKTCKPEPTQKDVVVQMGVHFEEIAEMLAENIYNKIRGLNPFPGALSYYDDQIIKVYLSEKIDKEYDGEYGEIVEILNKKGPVVKVKNGGIILKEVKFQGKKSQSGIDIINGRKIILNSKFGK